MDTCQIYEISNRKLYIPFANSKVAAGFPSPAAGYEEEKVDINDILVTNPPSTFYIRVLGNSMIDANISAGDILVVDRSIEATHGKIIIAVVDGDFTVKLLYNKDGLIKLVPANKDYPEITLKDNQELNVWGVVSYVIKKLV